MLSGIFLATVLLGILPSQAPCRTPTIKIASIYALSGPAVGASRKSVAGTRMAVDELNDSGGILDRPVELLEFDNQSSPIGSKIAAERALASGVVGIIGAVFSSHSLAVAKVAQANKIPMITNMSTSPSVTRVGDYIFRACYNDLLQGRVMAKFVREELGIQKVVTIYDMCSDYSLGIGATFDQAFAHIGGVVLAKIPYKARQANFRDIIRRAKPERPDALYIPGHYESARIVAEAMRSGLNAIMLGGDGWDSVRFYELGGKRIPIGYYTTHWHQAVETAPSRRFIARYGKDRTRWASTALAYDAVKLMADAIERAGSTRRTAIREALARTEGYEGVTGTISFDEHGDPGKSVVIIKIESGVAVYLRKVDPAYVD